MKGNAKKISPPKHGSYRKNFFFAENSRDNQGLRRASLCNFHLSKFFLRVLTMLAGKKLFFLRQSFFYNSSCNCPSRKYTFSIINCFVKIHSVLFTNSISRVESCIFASSFIFEIYNKRVNATVF